MHESTPLIRTKLRPPFVRPNLVTRTRLQAQIARGLEGPLTLVIAPAGFGKTTLVTASIAGSKKCVAWLSLDRDDNRPGYFLKYLIASLQESDPALGSEAAQFLAGMQQAADDAVLTSLINDLDAAAGERVLVLDDYQFINSQTVHAQLTFLLEHCPHNWHLLISTRSDPPLPLARLRARGQLVELRAAELRFTMDEAAQFLNDVMRLSLETGSVALLEQRTEGWVAGLQMAALSMRDREDYLGFIEGFSGTNRHIVDYLLEEILARQSPEIQHFLLTTSIMERLAAPLCDALLEVSQKPEPADEHESLRPQAFAFQPSALILQYLERENLFLIALDDTRTWFRYHHLFADLLRARLQHARSTLVPLLHIRASTWLEENGFIFEAIQQLFAAHEMERAADLIERYGPGRWEETDPSIVQLADSLPPGIVISRPKLGIYLAWLLICQGFIGRTLPLLDDLARQLTTAELDSGQQWMQTVVMLAQVFLTPRANTPTLVPLPDYQILDEVPAEEPILRDAAGILYGMILTRRGATDLAGAVVTEWLRGKKISREPLAIPALVAFLARIYFTQGRLTAAASLCREFLEPLKQKSNGLIYNAGNMKLVLGEVLYERNDLEDAEEQIREGLRANEPWKNILTDAFGLIALTRVLLAKMDYAGAMQIVENFETRLQEPSQPVEFHEELRTLRVRVQLASGDLQNASRWADQIHLNEDFRVHEDYYRFALARIRLAQERYRDVEELLKDKPTVSRSGNRITRQIESNLLLAAAVAAQQRVPDALMLVEASLALAEPEGYIRIFLDVGETVRPLLRTYLRGSAPRQKLYAQKVLDAFSTIDRGNTPHTQFAGLVEPLSERELEVLHLISLGNTNQEIARQLIVAPGTIKAHTASIYRKLDVANRTEAVSRAQQLGILPYTSSANY